MAQSKVLNPELIVNARQEKGLTLQALGEDIDVSRAALHQIENGVTTPTMETFARLIARLDLMTIPVGEFFDLNFFEKKV